jgi:catechol 2,3-dioxygenase
VRVSTKNALLHSTTDALPAETRLGPVELTVTDLDRTEAFYRDVIGLQSHRRDRDGLSMGAGGEDLLVFTENPNARQAGRHAGLYHVALLFSSRLELARAALRLSAARAPIQGASDHGTHEAIYLPDPDGNGLELAADRPREQWPDLRDANLWSGGPQPLDADGLFGIVAGHELQPRADAGTAVGHVDAAMRFYRDVIGFEAQVVLPTAGFVSAGGYHHHVAFNVWRREGVGPAPADAIGLRQYTVYVPSAAHVEALRERLERGARAYEPQNGQILARDPSGNALVVAEDPDLATTT